MEAVSLCLPNHPKRRAYWGTCPPHRPLSARRSPPRWHCWPKPSTIWWTRRIAVYILLSSPLIQLFNRNPVIVEYGKWLLISQVALPRLFAVQGIYAAQPAADVLTVLVCLFSIKPMQNIASRDLTH